VPTRRASERSESAPWAVRIAGDRPPHSLELVLTPGLLAVTGYVIDRAVGTMPLFSVLLGVFGVVGVFLAFWYRYDARMRRLETERSQPTSPAMSDDQVAAL
jgi:F0F1-type ATP synthase assembly protein I